MNITGAAKLAGVMGYPVVGSLSPRTHNYWLNQMGMDGAYVPLSVAPSDLEKALRALPALGFRGCNLTIPHKEAALNIVDEIDATADAIGAINTITVLENGKLKGSNTDAFGFITNLKTKQGTLTPHLNHVVVLGAGGAARAVVKALLDEGAKQITIVNRTVEKIHDFIYRFGDRVFSADYNELEALLAGASMLVNTTSLGMKGQDALALDISKLPETALVTDIVYNPIETELLRAAKARGNPTVDGLGMLMYQALPGFDAWFGKMPVVDSALREHLLAAL